MALVDPALIAPVRAGSKAPIAPLLRAAADAGRLSGELYSGLWRDIGTAQRLEELDALLRARMKAGT
jgi:N-acetyl-alpha-D-muramate 1-phosphate uridylyltransferase